ncbi:MAG: GNAT family N-acetyltransferase [Lamprobacter sp.]|uniref:GNAT family N-acetyltransferase n=1 Tax=Lamprobacter sp. TaxID=3100796 RepID=UPI002B25C890|nr:GNAT family N-acetyltransferase [Lamprobacter sp.]MEA3642400.1 GNAT family N-acetyltransferase [Lamprobacter sp.]
MDQPQIKVSTANLDDPTDAAALIALLDAYAADPMGAGTPLSAATRRELVPGLRAVPGACVLLARANRVPVGVAVCFTGFSTFRARPLTNVHDLAVLPSWRGHGIGKQLLAAVEAIARERNHCKVTLEVREDNPAARGLYRSLGFGAGSVANTDSGAKADDGQAVQYLFLEKRL